MRTLIKNKIGERESHQGSESCKKYLIFKFNEIWTFDFLDHKKTKMKKETALPPLGTT